MRSRAWANGPRVVAAVLASITVIAVSCDQYREAALVRAFPVGLARPIDARAMEGAIEVALARKGWKIVGHEGRRYRAHLTERVHDVDIAIDYDDRNVVINYVDSKNLLYAKHADGSETIHRKYNTWIKNLADDINVDLVTATAPRATAPTPL